MKKRVLIVVFIVVYVQAFCQNKVTKLFEYLPAPGQHINVNNIGTPQAAINMVANEDDIVSLGAFGGSIIIGFEQSCANDPQNPYGVDFSIFGNSFEGASEPGIVSVMKDENGNSQPDDTWYEIAGSNLYHPNTINNYSVTYFNPYGLFDIPWKDGQGNIGVVKANSYHEQKYYPMADTFPDYPHDSISFTGTLLEPTYYADNFGIIRLQQLAFGYADNHPVNQGIDLYIPDNPYTLDLLEGAGGDAIDISWAIDSAGNYVVLDEIDFVKITTANLADLGWLGEISTDVKTIVDVNPGTASGETESLVIYHHKQKLLVGDSLQIFAQLFDFGKPVSGRLIFQVSDSKKASIDDDGNLIVHKKGDVEVSVYPEGKEELLRKTLVTILEPTEISITSDLSSIYPGDMIGLEAMILDQNGEEIDGLTCTYSAEENNVFKIDSIDGFYYLVAKNPGNANLTVAINEFPDINKTFEVAVHEFDSKVTVSIMIKNEYENILPFQKVEVPVFDLNNSVENRIGDYSMYQRPMLAHVVAQALNTAEASYKFRDDEKSEGELYLYSVELDGLFTYGWGGSTDPTAFAKAWIARVNGNSYINSFDKITVNNGDTIILYHVSDLLNPWDLSLISVSTDSATIGDLIEVQINKTTCQLQGLSVTEQNIVPLVNQGIFVYEGETELYSGYTDFEGKYSFVLDSSPPIVVKAGNDAVLLQNRIATGFSGLNTGKLKIYPNPVFNILHLSGYFNTEVQIMIFNLGGQVIYKNDFSSLPESIDLSSLTSGQYMMKVTSRDFSVFKKIIKR